MEKLLNAPQKIDRLVVATHNAGKLLEIGALLEGFVGTLVSAGDLGLPEPEETGTTFAENAILKARAAAQGSGLPALADDSGLCVTALNGAPGIYSARWAGANRDFDAAMTRIHTEMGGSPNRSAAFVCALALSWPDGHTEAFEGRCNGHIIWPPRGKTGFGYDPFFVPEGYEKTFAEMTSDEKKALSHRRRAFDSLVTRLFLA
ncbi:MAG: RdgB/HAM1 family non-canonical purine NTP pyrophosphatase [Rhodospirillales bacterium]|nr:RdgB/HAM1 family non-canonical purine NTP pyrophosphatase [Rhodospirillales bacterium]